MARAVYQEGAALVVAFCDRLDALPQVASSVAAANLRQATGRIRADLAALVTSSDLSTPVLGAFDLARQAGATFQGFSSLFGLISGEPASGGFAVIIRALAIRGCVIQMARVLAVTEFASSDAVMAAQVSINATFGVAEDEAAAAKEVEVHRALVALHAAVTRDLTTRARPLPRIVTFAFADFMPALAMANRFYADAARGDELVAENGVRHPLFMPRTGQALSA